MAYLASLSKKAIEWILSTLAEINWRFLLWLDRIEAGKTTSEIASRAGVTTRQVQRGAKRARDWYEHRSLPRFKFIWPEGMLSPHSACRHGEIPRRREFIVLFATRRAATTGEPSTLASGLPQLPRGLRTRSSAQRR